ncbi:MAG: hypothetical protein IKN04_08975 [Clostridia bacterium]|nr:hypothetical protein [Clostridia bacterium]
MARSFLGKGAYLDVDMSDVQQKIALLRGVLKREAFERLLHRTFNEVGNRSKTIIAREVTQDYAVTPAWVRSQIERYRLETGWFYGVKCIIPLKGHKGSIGGRFRAAGGRMSIPLVAWIKRGEMGYLPTAMKNQGGNPPFMGTGKIDGVAFTRRTKDRLPIVRVVGLGVPQMPLNRSADHVQDAILELAGNRLEHNFEHMLGSGQLK